MRNAILTIFKCSVQWQALITLMLFPKLFHQPHTEAVPIKE